MSARATAARTNVSKFATGPLLTISSGEPTRVFIGTYRRCPHLNSARIMEGFQYE